MEKNMDKHPKDTHKLLENTLDYYEESMSFKFVDNLLNKTLNNKEDKKIEIYKNNKNNEEEIAAVDDYEDIDEKYLKRRYKYDDDDEIVYGFEKKQRKNDNIKKTLRNNYNEEDYDENINYNRYNQRKEQTIGDRIRQQRQIKNQGHNLYNNNVRMANTLEQNLRDRDINRLYETRNYDFNKNNNSSSNIKNLTVSLSVIFLLILSFLVYKINILSKDMEMQDSTIVKFRGKEYNLETLVYENEKFANKINKLEKEISSLQNEVQSAFVSKIRPNNNIITNNKNTKQDNINNKETNKKTQESNTTEKNIYDTKINNNKENIYSNLEEEFVDDYKECDDLLFEDEDYTVKAGDTLSYISQKFYGSKSQINKIKEANNLKTDDLKVGQKIKIPDK